jgi:hypothetical protein
VTKLLIAFAAVAALTVFNAPSVKAEVQYPWCAHYGHFGGAAENCGFSTLQQCMATVSGIGGSCDRNPMYRRHVKRSRR